MDPDLAAGIAELADSTDPNAFSNDDVISWFMLNMDMDAINGAGDLLSAPMIPFLGLSPSALASSDQRSVVAFTESVQSDSEDYRGENGSEYSSDDNNTIDNNGSKARGTKRKKPSGNGKGKSRETAKECRRKHQNRLEALENRVKALADENNGLREHIQMITQRKAEIMKHRTDMERIMARKVLDKEETENQQELQRMVKNYRDVYADYGEYRRKEVMYHLQQIEKLLLPSRITKMAMWTLNQDIGFFEKQKSPFWSLISKELELTSEQVTQMQQHRQKAQILTNQLKGSFELIRDLKKAIDEKHAAFDSACGKVESICTPRQTILFLMWISKNADKLAQVIPEFDRIVPHVPETANFAVKPLVLQEDETVHVTPNQGSSTSSAGIITKVEQPSSLA